LILFYPSFYEGFGLPPLEAMAYKLPVISSTGGSLNEIFSDYVLMFDPKDKKQLKNHIVSLLDNEKLRCDLMEKGLELVGEMTWESVARKVLEGFEEII